MKNLKVLLMLLVVSVGLIGCKKKEAAVETEAATEAVTAAETQTESESASETEETKASTEGLVTSYLTGMPVDEAIGRHRPVAIMLSNIIDAIPQAGIANAEIVYEAPVEGSLTRLMGIFEDYEDLEKIGSVRSCRDYYIFYAQEFEAVYSHYGQAIYALQYLDNDNVHNLSGLDAIGSTVYYRTNDRVAPHNAYTSAEGLKAGIEQLGFPTEYSDDYTGHYQFAKDGEIVELDGEDAYLVKPGYVINQPWFEYDEESRLYKRFQYGDIQIDELTNEQLAYTNVILQYSSWQNYDENGYLNIDTSSGGAGKYITGGKAIDITWSKDSQWGQTTYYNTAGEEITLNQGKTWVCIVLDTMVDSVEISGPAAE